MKIKRAFLAIAFALPLAGTAVAEPTGTGFKYICGKNHVVTFTSAAIVTLNKAKMDDLAFSTGEESGVEYKAMRFRKYEAAGGSSTIYHLKMVNGDAALYHQWVDADDQPKGPLRTEPCVAPFEVHEVLPGPSMGELRASEG